MTGNPLVATAVDTASPLSGTGLLDDGSQLVHAIESGDWLAGGLSAFAVGVDTVAAVSDPLGSLIASGLGWLIDHLEPLKGWFDDLSGDAGQVEAFAGTWSNIQSQLTASSAELTRRVADLDSLAGEAIDAYRRFQADAAAHLSGAASWAGAMASGLRVASQVVQVVHDLVRDVLSQLVGSAISWAAEAVFSLGLATPWIIEQVSTRVASWVAKIGGKLTELLTACKKLAGLLGELHGLISKAGALFESALRKAAPAVRRTVAGDHGAIDLDALMGRHGQPLSVAETERMIGQGYHTSIFGDSVVQYYDIPNAHLGAPNSNVWAMPTEDASKIHTPGGAAKETGMAQTVQDAYLSGQDIYAVHFPIDPASLRRPNVSDSGGWAHFYADPTNPSTTYGHTAVNTGSGAFLVNETRETLVPGGNPMPGGSVLTKLEDGQWVIVRRY